MIVVSALLIGLTFGTLFSTPPTAYAAASDLQKNTIVVQGTATVKTAPTLATINIGVNTFNINAAKAQQENAVKMTSVFSALKQLGINEKNIKTTSYTISPRYEWITDAKGIGKNVLAGYDVRNEIQVILTDLTKVSKVLDLTVSQGVNEASTITYGISEQEQAALYLQALKAAVKQAGAKADSIASVYNITLEKPIQITENYSVTPPIYYDSVVKSISNSNAASTPISSGDITIQAYVNVTYEW